MPVLVVDEEIYHRPPTMMIATVDKFAMMAWRGRGAHAVRPGRARNASAMACSGRGTTAAAVTSAGKRIARRQGEDQSRRSVRRT